MLTLLFDGVAFGMLLFLISVGLSVTLGLMNFTNLAHGAFAMLGGYTTFALASFAGWPFPGPKPLSAHLPAAIGDGYAATGAACAAEAAGGAA